MKKLKKQSLSSVFIRSIKLITHKHKLFWAFVLICNILMGLLPIGSLIIMQAIINLIQIQVGNLSLIFIYVGAYVLLEIISEIISSIYNYFYSKTSLQINKDLELLLLDKAATLNLYHFENSDTYNLINRAQQQGNGQILGFISATLEILKLIITSISFIVILSQFSIALILVSLFFPLLSYAYNLYINKKQYRIQKARTNEERKAWYITFVVTMGNAFKEIRLFGIYTYLRNKYVSIKNKIIKQDIAIAKQMYIILGVINFFDQTLSGVVFGYIIYCGALGNILIGNVVTYTKCVFNTKTNFTLILNQINNLSRTSLFLSFFYDFLDLDVDDNCKRGIHVPEIHKIQLKNVSYQYDKKYVLSNINLTLHKGEMVTLIGKNGSGKTTLIKIIMGFYNDYEGEIYINDINLKDIDMSSYIQRIGCLFQDFMQYEATVRENIGFGNLNCIDNDDKLETIIQRMNLKNVLLDDPRGIEMELGSWFDGGRQISIGEWQRVALARCFIKDADFYILDEPNASLDSDSENKILGFYKDLLSDKMGILITHRLNNLGLISDKIYVLSNGKIIEEGTHDQLLNLGGKYYHLFSIQCENISNTHSSI